MSDHESAMWLPADVEQMLDELLDTWAHHVQLPSQHEEEINAHLFTVSNDLGCEWWHSLFNHLPFQNTKSFAVSPYLNKRSG
ncbi:hypothetical protein [Bacillus sp. FJAT-28004]|uniref:hypothetical protein n=1 Tax=Bacillus sp. FJAT-28004 TaxID=1679165 RepID=UPI0006B539B4|nr:hypothetical protein [Bacillus sp. FJAT-28004]